MRILYSLVSEFVDCFSRQIDSALQSTSYRALLCFIVKSPHWTVWNYQDHMDLVVKCVVWDVVLSIHSYRLGESELGVNVTIDLIIVTLDLCITNRMTLFKNCILCSFAFTNLSNISIFCKPV